MAKSLRPALTRRKSSNKLLFSALNEILQRSSLKIRFNEPISVNVGNLRGLERGAGFHDPETQKFYEVCTSRKPKEEIKSNLSIPAKSEQTVIELKSLILAQIERWRHALHMQVERQRGELAPWRRVAHG